MSETDKVRSVEKEADLDRKIEEIRLRNSALEERHKIVTEEAKQNGVPKSFQKPTTPKSGSNHASLKTSETSPTSTTPNKKMNGAESKGNHQWSREWDRGKTSADEWKMNVPEFGDHGNSYFKTDANVTHNGRGRGRGGFQQRGGRRPAPAKHNPGFFHDDRYDEKGNNNKGEETGGAPDDKQDHGKKSPAKNYPRKPPQSRPREENDRNQNDSNKPNMNMPNLQGPRRGLSNNGAYRGAPRSRPNTTNHQSNDKSHNNNFVKDSQAIPKKFERNNGSKDGGKQQAQQLSGGRENSHENRHSGHLPHRSRGFKPNGKPANFNSPRPIRTFPKHHHSKPQNQKLDKDGQNIKRVIDNIIDQVVRQERNQQKHSDTFEQVLDDCVKDNENQKETEVENIQNVEPKCEDIAKTNDSDINEAQNSDETISESKVQLVESVSNDSEISSVKENNSETQEKSEIPTSEATLLPVTDEPSQPIPSN